MAYIPGSSHDIFISYASENNQDGWVEQFQSLLGIELTALLGRKFVPKESIYLDKTELRIAQNFSDELTAAARESAILLPILSPGYLTSDWCNRERVEFFSELTHGAKPAQCLAPIVVRPFNVGDLNSLYRNAQRLSFLSTDGLSPLTVGSPQWKEQIKLLASQLVAALQDLRQSYKPVYVGKLRAPNQLEDLRDFCCKEIERRHFRTVPESLQILDDINGLAAELQKASLAVHFIGGATDVELDAIQTSFDTCTGTTLLYKPYGLDLTPDERLWLSDFEKQLPAGATNYQRIEGKNNQELIALVEEQLAKSRRVSTAPTPQIQLALICDDLDLPSVRQLKEEILSRRTINVDVPNFLGTRLKAMERLRKWQEFVKSGKALVFYHGEADRERLLTIWQNAELQNQVAHRRWYLAPPNLEAKRQQDPAALWQIEQLLSLVEQAQGANA